MIIAIAIIIIVALIIFERLSFTKAFERIARPKAILRNDTIAKKK